MSSSARRNGQPRIPEGYGGYNHSVLNNPPMQAIISTIAPTQREESLVAQQQQGYSYPSFPPATAHPASMSAAGLPQYRPIDNPQGRVGGYVYGGGYGGGPVAPPSSLRPGQNPSLSTASMVADAMHAPQHRSHRNSETRSIVEQQGDPVPGALAQGQVQRLTPDSGGGPSTGIRSPNQPSRRWAAEAGESPSTPPPTGGGIWVATNSNDSGSSSGSPTGVASASVNNQTSTGVSPAPVPAPAQASITTTAPNNSFSATEDRFTVHRDRPLGEGAYGAVFMAFDNDLGSWAAVKETAVTSLSLAKGKVAALRAEFETLQNLSHPNIVKVFDYKLDERLGVAQIYMEWMSSGSVRSIIDHSRFRLHENVIRRYLSSALDGLAYLHGRNFLHRDVKPGNMLVSGDGTIKLSDFGTSKLTEGSMTATTTKTVIGTSAYLAPENLRDGKYSPASDMWALACSALEMGSGFHPWFELPEEKRTSSLSLMFHIGTAQPPNHHPLIPRHLSQTLKDILESWFHFDPKARPSAAAAKEHPYFKMSTPLPTDAESVQHYREARERYLSHDQPSTNGATSASQLALSQSEFSHKGEGFAPHGGGVPTGTESGSYHTTSSTDMYTGASTATVSSATNSLPPRSTSDGASITGSLPPLVPSSRNPSTRPNSFGTVTPSSDGEVPLPAGKNQMSASGPTPSATATTSQKFSSGERKYKDIHVEAALKLQALARMLVTRETYQRQRQAAKGIQALMRGFLTRKKVKLTKPQTTGKTSE
jgi:serine/threonine protein kinase